MAKVLALIAMVLLAGFTGGTGAAFSKQTPHMAFENAAPHTAAVDADSQSIQEAVTSHAHTGAQDGEHCCSDSTCFNANHCHHAGPAAIMLAALGGVISTASRGYELRPNQIPVQNVAHAISKPPRA